MRGSSLGAMLGAALVALPAVGLLTMGFLPEQEAYANADYGFSLLSALSGAGCIGYSMYHISRFGITVHSWPAIARLAPAAAFSDGPDAGENWPLLVALLFGPIPVLLAGFGGWIEACDVSRDPHPAAQYPLA